MRTPDSKGPSSGPPNNLGFDSSRRVPQGQQGIDRLLDSPAAAPLRSPQVEDRHAAATVSPFPSAEHRNHQLPDVKLPEAGSVDATARMAAGNNPGDKSTPGSDVPASGTVNSGATSDEATSVRPVLPQQRPSTDTGDTDMGSLTPSGQPTTEEHAEHPSEDPDPFRAYEAKVLEQREVGNTYRGVRDYTIQRLGITPEGLEGKTIVDVGSGYGGLAKSLSVERVNATVISVNPTLRIPENKAREENVTAAGLRADYEGITDEQIEKAQRDHDAHRSTSYAHDLSDVPSNTADLVVDNLAVHMSMTNNPLVYERTIKELLRITRQGGEIRSGTYGSTLWAEDGLYSTVLRENGIPFDLITRQRQDGTEDIIGARIYKR